MPYFTTDLRTALNRATLFMSVGESQRAVILYNRATAKYAVVDHLLTVSKREHFAELGYHLAVNLESDQLVLLTGSVQLDLLEEDVYAISQENL